jgi:hypothetical protein
MEIGENVENEIQNNPQPASAATATTLLHVQSQPIFCEQSSENNSESVNVRKVSKNRRVSFASSSQLTQFLEPISPFDKLGETHTHKYNFHFYNLVLHYLLHVENMHSIVPVSSGKELSILYKSSCDRHKTSPIPSIIEHLEALNTESSFTDRTEVLNLKQQTLTHESCEALEELFKRIKYHSIDLTSCSLDDISASAIFDMIEYYEACNELNISENSNIKNRGLQACKFPYQPPDNNNYININIIFLFSKVNKTTSLFL